MLFNLDTVGSLVATRLDAPSVVDITPAVAQERKEKNKYQYAKKTLAVTCVVVTIDWFLGVAQYYVRLNVCTWRRAKKE